MKLSLPVNRRLHAILITLLAISALFAYYFILYLPEQEEKLTIQRQEALLKIAENFQEKYKVYEKNSTIIYQKHENLLDTIAFYNTLTNDLNIDNIITLKNSLINRKAQNKNSELLNEISGIENQIQNEFENAENTLEKLKDDDYGLQIESSNRNIIKNLISQLDKLKRNIIATDTSSLVHEFNELKKNYKSLIENILRKAIDSPSSEITENWSVNEYLSFSASDLANTFNAEITKDANNRSLFLAKQSNITVTTDTLIFSAHNNYDTHNVSFGTLLSDFFSSIERNDYFGEYIILKDRSPIYNSTKSDVIQLPEFYAKTEKIEKESFFEKEKRILINSNIISIDSLHKKMLPPGLEVKLNSQAYKFFATSFHIKNANGQLSQWHIFGLDSVDRFTSESRVFPILIIVFICTGLLFFIFALPTLKLFFMNGLERLHIKDIILTSSSFIFCCGLIIISALTLIAYHKDKSNVDDKLENLVKEIETNLNGEVEQIHKLIAHIEDSVDQKQLIFKLDTIGKSTRVNAFQPRFMNYLYKYPHLTAAYWVNTKGYAEYMVSSSIIDDKIIEKLDLNERQYFKEIKEGRGWVTSLFEKDTFYIESISSWTSGNKTAIISKPSLAKTLAWNVSNDSKDSIKGIGENDGIEIIAIEAKLYSVIDPVLPLGYNFSIINDTGKVLFHSDKSKNLEENFLEECGYNKQVAALINSQSKSLLDLNFYNRDHRVYMKSLENLPWHIVVAYDKTLIQAPYLYITSTSIIGVVIIGLINVLLSTIVALVYQRKSKLKRKVFPFKWLWPYKKSTDTFITIAGINLILIVCLSLFNWYHFYHSSNKMVLALSASSYALILSYSISFAILARPKDRIVQSLKEIILNLYSYDYILIYIVILSLLLTITFIRLTNYVLVYSCIFGIVIFIIAYFAYLKSPKDEQKVKKPSNIVQTQTAGIFFSGNYIVLEFMKKRYNAFIFIIFTYLMLSSIFPAFFIFRTIHDQEKLIQKKYAMHHIASEMENRKLDLRDRHENTWLKIINDSTQDYKDSLEKAYESINTQGLYHEKMGYNIGNCNTNGIRDIITTPFEEFIYTLKPALHDHFEKNSGFSLSESSSKNWESKLYAQDSLLLTYFPLKYPNQNDTIKLTAQIPKLFPDTISKPTSINGIILAFIFIFFLLLLWKTIRYTILKMFGLNLYAYPAIIKEDDRYLLDIDKKNTGKLYDLHDKNELNIFVISTPFSHTKDILKEKKYIPLSLSQTLDDNLYQEKFLTHVKSLSNQIVVIEDFGYGIDTVTIGKRALEVIKILQSNHNKIVIISKLTPKQVIEKYEKLKERDLYKNEDLDLFISKWKDLLAEFVEMYFSYVVSNTANRKRLPENADCNQLLEYELGVHKPYFSQLDGSICNVVEKETEGNEKEITFVLNKTLAEIEDRLKKEGKTKELETFKEELLLKIQTLASPFYFALWNACSKDEKFFLYDLSTDDFANTKNTDVIIKLLEKGLIYCDESLHIINESFRNFILNIDKAEALEMERELQRNGTWKVYSSVIVMLIIGLIVFFIFANESIIEQFSALIAGLAAVLPYVLRMGGIYQPSAEEGIKS